MSDWTQEGVEPIAKTPKDAPAERIHPKPAINTRAETVASSSFQLLFEKNRKYMYQKSIQIDRGRWSVVATGDGHQADGFYLAPDYSDFAASGPPIWARASKVTGMVISADCVAVLGSGASTVSVPSGDREEDTRVGSTPGGSLDAKKNRTKVTHPFRPRALCSLSWIRFPPPLHARNQNSRVFPGKAPRDVAMFILSFFVLACGWGPKEVRGNPLLS